jgi:hypothetical protein
MSHVFVGPEAASEASAQRRPVRRILARDLFASGVSQTLVLAAFSTSIRTATTTRSPAAGLSRPPSFTFRHLRFARMQQPSKGPSSG